MQAGRKSWYIEHVDDTDHRAKGLLLGNSGRESKGSTEDKGVGDSN